MSKQLFFILMMIQVSISNYAQSDKIIVHNDLLFAAIGSRVLSLDLYLPTEKENPPIIVWIHGGAWHSGSKDDPPLDFLPHGYALASIEYRLSTEATFPAQIKDIKAAIQWLRGHSDDYGFNANKVVVWGSSAGGHLAALVGTTNGVVEFDPDYGHHNDQSTDVQGIIDYFGLTDFLTILDQSTPHGRNVRMPAMTLLFGEPIGHDSTVLKMASPVLHVDPSDPPLFIAHGNQDIQVPINQSIELLKRYEKNGLYVRFEILENAGHGGNEFHTEEIKSKVVEFLQKIYD